MGIALPKEKNNFNDNSDSTGLKSIEEKVIAFRKWLLGNKQYPGGGAGVKSSGAEKNWYDFVEESTEDKPLPIRL
jgi:hypothetical protein